MEEIEVPLEKVQEDMQHHAAHGGGGSGPSWINWGALLSAFLAVFAAVAALLSGHHANEAMIEQVRSSDRWSYYQAKSIKASLLETRRDMQESLGRPLDPAKTEAKLADYRKQQEEISAEAKELEAKAEHHLVTHQTLAKAVTLFQIAIAITAIAVLARRRAFLGVAGAFGALGLVFLILGTLLSH